MVRNVPTPRSLQHRALQGKAGRFWTTSHAAVAGIQIASPIFAINIDPLSHQKLRPSCLITKLTAASSERRGNSTSDPKHLSIHGHELRRTLLESSIDCRAASRTCSQLSLQAIGLLLDARATEIIPTQALSSSQRCGILVWVQSQFLRSQSSLGHLAHKQALRSTTSLALSLCSPGQLWLLIGSGTDVDKWICEAVCSGRWSRSVRLVVRCQPCATTARSPSRGGRATCSHCATHA